MPKIAYESLRFFPKTLAQIAKANEIIEEYAGDGYTLTLRQLYYQFVARALLPNTVKSYKQLGSTISKARRAGLLDWRAIVDRTRMLRAPSAWDSPADILRSASYSFKHDRWSTQPAYVEVWFEKDALMGVFERPAAAWRLPFFSCRGYPSDSEVWSAAQRLAEYNKPAIILHFGDHDPSGIDMTRDIEARLQLFGAPHVEVRRLALNMEQVQQYEPPPNPAKESDSRFSAYETLYGSESWELDALDPKVLARLVSGAVEDAIDVDEWNAAIQRENEARVVLVSLARDFDGIVDGLRSSGALQKTRRRMRRVEDARLEPQWGGDAYPDSEDDGDE